MQILRKLALYTNIMAKSDKRVALIEILRKFIVMLLEVQILKKSSLHAHGGGW